MQAPCACSMSSSRGMASASAASPARTAICRRLGAQGLPVYVHANRHLAEAERVAAEIGGAAVAFDVTDAQATQGALERLLAAGPIQILVNNAGIHDDAVMPAMKAEQWRRVIDV